MNHIETGFFQAVRPYEDPSERLNGNLRNAPIAIDQPRSSRTLTFARRYVLKEAVRNRVDISGITGRSKIGLPIRLGGR